MCLYASHNRSGCDCNHSGKVIMPNPYDQEIIRQARIIGFVLIVILACILAVLAAVH